MIDETDTAQLERITAVHRLKIFLLVRSLQALLDRYLQVLRHEGYPPGTIDGQPEIIEARKLLQ